jgi:hypothetical protein
VAKRGRDSSGEEPQQPTYHIHTADGAVIGDVDTSGDLIGRDSLAVGARHALPPARPALPATDDPLACAAKP